MIALASRPPKGARLFRTLALVVLYLMVPGTRAEASPCTGSCKAQAKLCTQTARTTGKSLKAACTGRGKARKACRQRVSPLLKGQLFACRAMKAVCLDCCERDGIPCGIWCGDGAVDANGGEQCDPPGTTVCPGGGACEIDCQCPEVPTTCGDGVVTAPAEECDLGSRNGAADACCTGACRFADAGTVCRNAAGACDAVETCTGSGDACPADAHLTAGAVCRSARGECDVAEQCTGLDVACPADARKANATPCTPDASSCTDDACDGETDDCRHTSNDQCHCGNGVVETNLGEECDQGVPNGAASACCTSGCSLRASGEVCRSAAGTCDVVETCSGASPLCPSDGWAIADSLCRAAAGECDLAETCSGTGPACPPDAKKTTSTACADDGNPCTTDACDGTSAVCVHAAVGAGTVCRTARGECDLAETCAGSVCPVDAHKPAAMPCTPDATTCTDDACDGENDACQHTSNDTCHCGNGLLEPNLQEQCDEGPANGADTSCCTNTCTLRAVGSQCRDAAGECDLAETCSGLAPACPGDVKKPASSPCGDDGNICTLDRCDGTSDLCQHPAGNAGTTCRSAAGECDVAETCSGAGAACPADGKKAATTGCADDGNVCTLDRCDGTSDLCQHPAGNAGVECRSAAGECDVAETCSGTSPACPPDDKKVATIPCSGDGNPCTVDECDGTTDGCPHVPGNVGVVCRSARGECDISEACDGGATCPIDVRQPAATPCTPDATTCTDDLCDGQTDTCQHTSNDTCRCGNGVVEPEQQETCDQGALNGSAGSCCTSTCTLRPAATSCRPAAGECDLAEACSGSSPTCPVDTKQAASTPCADDGSACTLDHCDGTADVCQHPAGNAGLVCRSAAGECDLAEACSGTSPTCPVDTKKAASTPCADDGSACTLDRCDGTAVACQHPAGNAGTVCRSAAGECDLAETCSGTSPTCPVDTKKAASTPCADDGNACTLDRCDGTAVACQHPAGNAGTVCRSAAGGCDIAETCSGTSVTCPADGRVASGTVCRSAAGTCDMVESCNGGTQCPANAFVGAGTVCRAGSGDVCDPSEQCSGSGPLCPSDVLAANGTQCRAAGACPPAETCSGVPGVACPADVCAPAEDLLGCYPLESGPGQRADLPDVWNVPVQSGVPVTVTADTVDAATAANLCFTIQCPGQSALSGNDEVPCTFAPPAAACPQRSFVPAGTATCRITVGLCSSACADDGRARYALRVLGAVPALAVDDGIPVARATGTLPCGPLGDRYEFQATAGQEVVVRTDTVDAASAASLCVSGSCTNGERFVDEYDTADCSAGAATYRCVEKHFVPPANALCKVQVTACRNECAAAQASYRLEVAGTAALTPMGDNVAAGTCGNGQREALEVCGESGLPGCPSGWSCVGCACQRTMPDLLGMRPYEMRSLLDGLGIRTGRIAPLVSVQTPPVHVQGQSITAGTPVRSGDAVDVVMSLPVDTGDFLTRRGFVEATEASAAAYYAQIDPCGQRTTLATWRAANGFDLNDANESSAIYENHNDLGFGRRMHVRRNAADNVAYYVQNFPTVDDAWQHPERILATVAMEYTRPINPATCAVDGSKAPFVKFFTFGANGGRILKIDLDGRGDKYQPEMCTVCHGGFAGNAPFTGGDIGARFIPFDLESFEYSKLNPRLGQAHQEGAFRELNRAVVNEVAPTASTTASAKDLVCGWYGGCALPNPTFNADYTPADWINAGMKDAYDGVIKTGCRGCHAQLGTTFAFASHLTNLISRTESYVCEQGFMPIARRTFENFWLGLPGRPYGPLTLHQYLTSGDDSCFGSGPTVVVQPSFGDPISPIVAGPFPADPTLGIGGPRAVAVDDAGDVYFTGFTSSRVMRWSPATSTQTLLLDNTGGGVASFMNATGIAVDHQRNVFAAANATDVVLRVSPQGAVTKVLDATGDGVHPFDSPFGDCIGVDDAGNLYAAGFASHNVFKRTPGGQITQIVGAQGDGTHPLTQPFALAVAGNGTVWVAGRSSDNVLRVDPDGTISQVIGPQGDGQGHLLDDPFAVAVGRQGSVVVAALGSKNAFRIWPDGQVEYLSVPMDDTSLGLGVTVDEADNVYVAIRAEHNVYQVTPGGGTTHLLHGNSAGGSAGFYDMAVDPRIRRIWIAARDRLVSGNLVAGYGVVSMDFGQPFPP